MFSLISTTNNLPVMFPPLLLIVSISMIKDGYENYQHYKSDCEENNKEVKVVEDGKIVIYKW